MLSSPGLNHKTLLCAQMKRTKAEALTVKPSDEVAGNKIIDALKGFRDAIVGMSDRDGKMALVGELRGLIVSIKSHIVEASDVEGPRNKGVESIEYSLDAAESAPSSSKKARRVGSDATPALPHTPVGAPVVVTVGGFDGWGGMSASAIKDGSPKPAPLATKDDGKGTSPAGGAGAGAGAGAGSTPVVGKGTPHVREFPTVEKGVKHKDLHSRGEAVGRDIAADLKTLTAGDIANQLSVLTTLKVVMVGILTEHGVPVHKAPAFDRAFAAVDDKSKVFSDSYRASNPGMDELVSTRGTQAIFSGIVSASDFAEGSKLEALVKLSLEILSLVRLPTGMSGHHVELADGTVHELQHPTSKDHTHYSTTGKAHFKQDLGRRRVVVAFGETTSHKGVLKILAMARRAIAETLNVFTAPPKASNVTTLSSVSEEDKKLAMTQREAMKEIDFLFASFFETPSTPEMQALDAEWDYGQKRSPSEFRLPPPSR